MVHTIFWTGLSNQSLKNSTRHLFDTVKDFQLLLHEMGKVEQEQVSATVSRPAGKPKVAQQHSEQTSDVPDTAQLLKQLNEMMEKMKVMEKKMDSRCQRPRYQSRWIFQGEFKLTSSSVVGQTEEASNVSIKSPGTKKEEKRSSFLADVSVAPKLEILFLMVRKSVDTGSQITSVSESFYKSINPVPELGDIKDFDIDLSVQGAAGNYLPYKGYIETEFQYHFYLIWF